MTEELTTREIEVALNPGNVPQVPREVTDQWSACGPAPTPLEIAALHAGWGCAWRAASERLSNEIVICAAVRFNGKVWRGNRHANAITAMNDELSWSMNREQMCKAKIDTDQGFVTSRNRYVDREEGLAIQIAAGVPPFRGEYGNQLYSEDLY